MYQMQNSRWCFKRKNVGCISITRNTSQEAEIVGTICFRKTVSSKKHPYSCCWYLYELRIPNIW
ncbi:unnamed protein product, partial [Callosobruchus maculatus]